MKFELQPTLVGRLVTLRPLREDDFEALYAVSNDPLLWEQHPEPTRWQRPVFEKFFRGAMESGGAFLVLDAATGEAIGSSRYHRFEPAKNQIEIGYTFLARRCWGEGHNTEMKKLMLDHAFRFVKTVVFHIGENNLRSRKAIERIGAVFSHREAHHAALTGANIPSVVYKIERNPA